MKKSIVAVLSVAAVLGFQSCRKISGNGPSITKTYSLSGFTAVNTGIDGDVYFTQDSVYKVEIYGQSNILDRLETPIVNGELRLEFRKYAHLGNHERVVAYISGPSMNGLTVNGSGSLSVNQSTTGTRLNLRVSGSGSINVASYTGNELIADISGSGRINVNGGNVNNENLHISGSGDMNLLGIVTKNATTSTSGSGNISLYVTSSLDVRISGSGDVYYVGNPSVSASISGSGKVTHQ
jgi:hypothetical protein